METEPDGAEKELEDAAISSINPEITLTMERYHVAGSLLEVDHIIKEYEKHTFSKFVSDKTDKGFNREDWQKKTKFKWKMKGFPLLDPNVPAMYLGAKLLTCQHGKDRNLNLKKKWKEKQDRRREQNIKVRTYNRAQRTKKMDCPATIWIKKMATFPNYRISKSSDYSKKTAANKFWLDKKKNPQMVNVVMQYLIVLPDPNTHKNHPIGQVKDRPVKEIVQAIEALAARKIYKIEVILKHLDEFRRNTLFKNKEMPPSSNRGYFPNEKDIYNILYRCKQRNRSSPAELQQIEELVQNWSKKNPDDSIYYRNKIKVGENSSFILMYQSTQQKRLLNLYGELVVLDAVHRTIDYPVPLYCLCVQTNVAYQIVGMFVVYKGNTITNALSMFKTWNPDWNPKYLMLDFGEMEELTLKNLFPDCKLYMTDFHRERRWEEWGNCSDNGITTHMELMMSALRKIADASTTINYLAAVAGLTESQVWKDSVKFQEWVNTIWLPISQKWVKAFKPAEMVFHVHNSSGLEMMKELLPFAYLSGYKNSAVSVMVEELITNFMPMVYNRYEQQNLEGIDGHLSNPRNIPVPVMNTPKSVVDTYIAMSDKAASTGPAIVQINDDSTFMVNINGVVNTVDFGNCEKLPVCHTCPTWESKHLPCEHFHAVFQSQHVEWGWEKLCPQYRNYPCLVLDHGVIPSTVDVNQEATDAAYFVTCRSTNEIESDVGEEMEQTAPSLAEQCRDCLKEISDITFSLEDNTTLQNLLATLQETKYAIKIQQQTPSS